MGPTPFWPRSSRIRCPRTACVTTFTATRCTIRRATTSSIFSSVAAAPSLPRSAASSIRATCRWCARARARAASWPPARPFVTITTARSRCREHSRDSSCSHMAPCGQFDIQHHEETPRMNRAALTEKILDIKREKGWSWKHICEEIGGYSPVLLVGALLGQMKLTKPQAAKAGELFGLSAAETALLNEVPMRGAGVPMPPTDPLIYRFYELVMVNGPAWKALIEEEFGDGIMSAIDFDMQIERLPNPKGDRVKVTMSGKFLPYKYYGNSGNVPEYGYREEQ